MTNTPISVLCVGAPCARSTDRRNGGDFGLPQLVIPGDHRIVAVVELVRALPLGRVSSSSLIAVPETPAGRAHASGGVHYFKLS